MMIAFKLNKLAKSVKEVNDSFTGLPFVNKLQLTGDNGS